jgi:hypothetical protein
LRKGLGFVEKGGFGYGGLKGRVMWGCWLSRGWEPARRRERVRGGEMKNGGERECLMEERENKVTGLRGVKLVMCIYLSYIKWGV